MRVRALDGSQDGAVIALDLRIRRHECELFDSGLGNQHAIEWIPMVPRQRRHFEHVLSANHDLLAALLLDCCA